jgi:hypothetical protein
LTSGCGAAATDANSSRRYRVQAATNGRIMDRKEAREPRMKPDRFSLLCIGAALALAAWPAWAADGLAVPSPDWLWPRIQARITVQTAALTPAPLARPGEASLAARGVQGAALLGDYLLFTQPALGSLRASSGLMLGILGGAPGVSVGAGTRLGLTMLDGGVGTASEPSPVQPYLGLGYRSPPLWGNFSLTADVGVVAAHPAGIGGLGRAVFGSQAMDQALREMRLAPLLQLGVRYSF